MRIIKTESSLVEEEKESKQWRFELEVRKKKKKKKRKQITVSSTFFWRDSRFPLDLESFALAVSNKHLWGKNFRYL